MGEMSAIFWHSFCIATDKDISEVVEAYRQISIKEFSDEELAFGRAVCCLRHLCIYKVEMR